MQTKPQQKAKSLCAEIDILAQQIQSHADGNRPIGELTTLLSKLSATGVTLADLHRNNYAEVHPVITDVVGNRFAAVYEAVCAADSRAQREDRKDIMDLAEQANSDVNSIQRAKGF